MQRRQTIPSLARLIPLLGLLAILSTSHAQPLNLHFCTHVGPLNLTIDNGRVSGDYQINLPQRSTSGTFSGSIEANLVDARWVDGHGAGRILLGLSADHGQFSAIYNAERQPEQWYGWSGQAQRSEPSNGQSASSTCGAMSEGGNP